MDEPINWGIVASWAVPIVVSVIGVWGGWVSHKAQQGSPEHALIKLLQEQIDSGEERSDKQDARMEKIEAELKRFKKRERIRDEYIIELRSHINTEKGPPAPPFPEGLDD